MNIFWLVLKSAAAFILGAALLISPEITGGDFPQSERTGQGDAGKYLHISADNEGFDTWQPVKGRGGYRYGPSMILNSDGSLDVWSAANGPGDIIDIVGYKRWSPGFEKSTKEVVALKPTPESLDERWTCDPGVIKFGGWYYIGYTTTADSRGTDNDVCVARSRNPEGPFTEKWTGNSWGVEPQPLVEYTDNPDCFGAGEPSFVLLGDTLYIYYSWNNDRGTTTRVATADAKDENWPATLQFHGECIPPKNGGDSSDVKYIDEFGRFVAVFTEKRFSDESYVAVWESFDGLSFRPSGFVKANTAKKLHNCGISGRADGHIGKGDPVYLSYAYGGAGDGDLGNWATRIHKVTLSLADSPDLDTSAEQNAEITVNRKNISLIPEIITVKAEKQVYTISKNRKIWIMAIDNDGFCFPLFAGMTFDGYDESVVRISGTTLRPVNSGTTRVTVHWHGLSGDFVVHVEK